ncbi:non-ribosomal peptide synthetase [Microtetraspora niveoalba]|uniref:non-ribosomal peptide synthetase n=1 Tax=Microtetraspora niveoalba TaxID=46175 RepID=UPI0008354961|nr:non-ribosomal peptide synthetase [Microtetraspora niveoalba]
MRLIDAYPLSMLQSGMLLHSQDETARSTYRDILSLEVAGPLDLEILQQAVNAALARHATLRTGFDLTSFSEPMQLLYEDIDAAITMTDLRDLAEEDQARKIEEWFEEEKTRPLDWSRPPLARFHVHRLADQRHRVGLTFHHAILDGWSLASLVTELMARCQGVTDLPKPSVSMADYVALERQALDDPEAKRFWQQTLSGRPFTALPRWPERESADHCSVRVKVEREIADRLQELARDLGVPVRSAILTAHLAVLRLLSGEHDLCTGLVTHGRPETAGGDAALGLFLNTVPFRFTFPKGTWREVVSRVFEAETRLLPYRRYPLAQLHRDHLQAGESLFEVAFDFRNFHVYESLGDDGQARIVDSKFFERNNFPITVNAGLSGSELELNFVSDPREFPAAQLHRMAGYYTSALAALAYAPDQPVTVVDLLSEAERKELIGTWNDTAADWPDATVDQLIREQARRTPDAYAVGDLTYGELVSRADSIAADLHVRGIGRGSLVGVCMGRSPEMVVAILGVLVAGAAYVPIDPAYPAERISYVIEDAGMPVILTSGAAAESLPVGAAALVDVGEVLSRAPVPHLVERDHGAGDLMYVIYTSGSTGRPKGVMVSHGNVANLLHSMAEQVGAGSDDVVVALTSLSFDIAALELFLPLISGARLVVAGDLLFEPERALAQLPAPPTLMQATPSVWRQITAGRSEFPRSMRVLCGGEALPDDLAADLAARFDQVWNVYGPTETTIWSSADPVVVSGRPSLGYPLANTQLYVLDAEMSPVPPGTPGELYIGGDGVTWGYLNQPALTAGCFVADPFSDTPGARLYRTGDVARRLPDGRIEFLGRLDHQVKLRGHRIELAEVEAAIMSHPSVHSAAVVLQEDGPDDRRLIAYVVLKPDARPPSDPRGYLAAKLPVQMVPAAFIPMEALPLTPNGKIDRKALPRAGRDRPVLARTPTPPRDDLERDLAKLWAETLRFESIGVYDQFFDLGGDSLLALRLLAKVRQEFASEVPASVLFEQGTVAAMAESVRSRSEGMRGPAVVLSPEGDRTPLLCVHPLGGHVFCYREMAGHFGAAGHKFYAFQAPGLEHGEPMESIEELAAHYLEAAKAVQPHGPYLLTGWCMGGVVAFEMARQLEAAGEKVGLLGIISSNANEPVPEAYAQDEIRLLLDVVYAKGLDLTPDDLAGLTEEERFSVALAAAKRATDIRQDILTKDQLKRITRVYGVHARASLAYRPDPLAANAVLYRPSEGHEGAPHDLGWAPLVAGRLDIETVQGTHYSLLSGPNGAALAARMIARIAGEEGSGE